MNIYLHEIKRYTKYTLIWTFGLVCTMLLYFSMYGTIAKDADAFIQLMDSYPDWIIKVLGLEIRLITTVLGFYSFTLNFVTLFAGIQAMLLGLSIVSKESREKTADFLLTKPISRTKIITSKILAGLSTFLFTIIVFFIFVAIITYVVKLEEFNFTHMFLMTLTLLIVQVIFFFLGVLISIIIKKVRSPLPISLGIVFGFFAIAFFVDDKDDFFRYLTPFKYFDTIEIMLNGKFELLFVIITVLIVFLCGILSIIIYNKKDIHSV